MLYFQCYIHEYIVGSGGSPIFIPIELIVKCVPNQTIYPIFIDTDSTTDVHSNRLMLHISCIYYYLCHWESLNRWQGSWYAKYCSCRWLIKLDILYAYILYVSLGLLEAPCTVLAKNVHPRRIYIYIVQRRWWQRHCNRIVMIRCT